MRLLLALVASSGFLVAQGSAATVEEGVSAAFAKFKQALAARDGAAAARYIDDRTAAFYARMRRAALRMPQDRLLKQPLFFQVGVFSTRLRFSKEEVEKTDGRGLYAKLAAGGDPGIPGDALTVVKIQPTRPGASAIAQVSTAARPDNIGLRVFTQGGAWKIDLSRLLQTETKELQDRLGITAKTPPETVKLVIERDLFPIIAQQSGKPAAEKLWAPLDHAN
jgi:hypothetical protein